jgi:hypothetical protein
MSGWGNFFVKRTAIGETVERRTYLVRGRKVMLDSGAAERYRVPGKVLV